MITRAEIKFVRSLADKRTRDEEGLFVAEGEKLVGEIAASQLRIRRIFALDGVLNGIAGVERVPPAEMERLSMLKTPSSCIAVVEKPHYALAPEQLRKGLTLALDDVQNPGNMGTIIRLADWFGIENIICSPACADCFAPKVVQATMGAILRVKVHYTPLPELLGAMRRAGEPVYGTLLEGGRDIYGAELASHGVIVMGNEGRGLSPAVAETLTERLYIPPYPFDRSGSESLNVAIATAVVCAEFRRRENLYYIPPVF